MIRPLTLQEMNSVAGGYYSTDTSPMVIGGGGGDGDGDGGAGGDTPPQNPGTGHTGSAAALQSIDVDLNTIDFVQYLTDYGIDSDAQTVSASSGGQSDGHGGGYDSADYNGPQSVYQDYFASQHGPESIEIRASISAQAFFNYAANYQDIAFDISQIVNNSSSVETAQNNVDSYLQSVGLNSQVHVDIGSGAISGGLGGFDDPNGGDIVVSGYTPHYSGTLPASYYNYATDAGYAPFVGDLSGVYVNENLGTTPDWGKPVGVVDPITHLPVRSATGALLLWPKGINPSDVFNAGYADGSVTGLAKLPSLFKQGGYYDFQRSGSADGTLNHPEFVDASTVGIGIYSRAANIPLETVLSISNNYAMLKSHYAPGTVMDKTYTYLPARNVENTIIGYNLANHIAQVTNSD